MHLNLRVSSILHTRKFFNLCPILSVTFGGHRGITSFYGWLRLPTQDELTDLTFNSIHKKHNNPPEYGVHSLMKKRQITTKAYANTVDEVYLDTYINKNDKYDGRKGARYEPHPPAVWLQC